MCNLQANLARDRLVTSNSQIFDVYSNWMSLTDGLYEAKLGVNEDSGHSTCTEPIKVEEIGFFQVKLD